MNEIKKLREQSGLTQKEAAEKVGINDRTFGSYERGERTPDYKTMDRIRRVLGDGTRPAKREGLPDHVRRVRVDHVGAGPGQTTEGSDTILLDERLFAGSGIDFDGHFFMRVQGSSMAEVISHGQIVVCEPADEVVGQDIYVYWRGDEAGNVVAIMDRTPDGLRIEKRGPTRSVTDWTHRGDGLYEAPDGRQTKIQIQGRVLGCFSRPANELAERQAAAISAATALQNT